MVEKSLASNETDVDWNANLHLYLNRREALAENTKKNDRSLILPFVEHITTEQLVPSTAVLRDFIRSLTGKESSMKKRGKTIRNFLNYFPEHCDDDVKFVWGKAIAADFGPVMEPEHREELHTYLTRRLEDNKTSQIDFERLLSTYIVSVTGCRPSESSWIALNGRVEKNAVSYLA